MNCLGCQLANKKEEVHLVFEDEYISCILDHQPFNEGHVLILPKQHARYFDELDDHTAKAIVNAAKILSRAIKVLYNPDGITVCQNGGSFDDLTHFHMHVVPRSEDQNFASFFTDEGEENVEESCKLEETKRKFIQVLDRLNEESIG